MKALREAWWYLRHGRRSLAMQERNWQELLRVNQQLADEIERLKR